MTTIIGITGPKRVGKDTFGHKLMNHYGCEAWLERIAQPLYDTVSSITGIPINIMMNDDAIKEMVFTKETAKSPNLIGHSPRSLLIDQGNFYRDKYGEDFLINNVLNCANMKYYKKLIIVDVRTNVESEKVDVLLELFRDGVDYIGGRTESGITIPHKRKLKIKLNNDKNNIISENEFQKVISFIENKETENVRQP